jgi:hypothetical protein
VPQRMKHYPWQTERNHGTPPIATEVVRRKRIALDGAKKERTAPASPALGACTHKPTSNADLDAPPDVRYWG